MKCIILIFQGVIEVDKVSTTQISLRLGGEIPSSEELTQALGIKPTKFVRRGEHVSKKRVQPVDLWILELAQFDTDSTEEERDSQMLQVATTLQTISSNLAILDQIASNS